MNVVAVADGIRDVSAAVLWTVTASVLSADSHVLWSRHLLLRCCHGNDGNDREAALGTVSCSQLLK